LNKEKRRQAGLDLLFLEIILGIISVIPPVRGICGIIVKIF
jgi:hypothetical protein